jgi:hypothetical protein
LADVTVNRARRTVSSDRRKIYSDIDIAADGDTYDTKLRFISAMQFVGSGGNVIDGTKSGGVITFNTSGAETGVLCEITGF